MGVTIEVWRCKVGLHLCRATQERTVSHDPKKGTSLKELASRIKISPLLIVVIAALLLIGNVEPNPGPSFKCPSCQRTFSSISKYAHHQKIHSCDSNFMFTCPKPLCYGRFTSQNGLLYHFRSMHSSMIDVDEMPSGKTQSPYENWNSVICTVPSCTEMLHSCHQFCKHFQSHVERGDQVFCPLRHICCKALQYGGPAADGKAESKKLGRHLSIYHPGWTTNEGITPPIISQPKPSSCDPAVEFSCSFAPESQDSEVPTVETEEAQDLNTDDINSEMLSHLFGKFYLMLLADYILPEVQVQGISERMAYISELLQLQTKLILKKALDKTNLTSAEVTSIINEILLSDVLYNIHHKNAPGPSLTSEHLRLKYFRENFSFVDPTEMPLDFDPYGATVAYVPIKNTLTLILQDPVVKEHIDRSFGRKESTDGYLRDYYDGSVYKQRAKSEEKNIDILIFQDGFAVTNPLGSAKHSHNLVGVYFTVGNLEPYMRSKLKLIHLVSLFNADLLNSNAGFQPLVEELQALKNDGVDFNGQKYSVSVQFFIGDNLGSHAIGGFTESFNHEYFCRFCEVTRPQLLENPGVCKPFRTPQEYEDALEELVELKKNNPRAVTHRALKQQSLLNDIYPGAFHVCDPSLPPCLGHDLFEGVVNWDLFSIISNLVKEKWITFSQLNKRIAHFKYSKADLSNKPAPLIESGSKLGGHAVQNWCLLRLLPFFLEGCIADPSNEYWRLYLLLRKIVEYACAPAFSDDDLNKYDALTQEYMVKRKILKTQAKPKHHFLAHYPALTRLVGPLIHLWTLRFESKHSFFKEVARICKNFINVVFTLAKKHQLYLAYVSSGPIFHDGMSSCKESTTKIYEEVVTKEIESGGLPSNALHYDSLTIGEILYKKGMYLLLEAFNDNREINVGLIEAIILQNNSVSFVLKVYSAVLQDDFGLFCIKREKAALTTTFQEKLKYPVPQPVYDFADDLCFSVKFHLEC